MVLQAIFALFIKYGFVGLFFSSLVSSLFFIPGYSTLLIPLYIALKFNPYLLLIILTAGSTIGQTIDYYIGFYSSERLLKYKKEIKNATKWLNKWGDISLFIINLIPISPADFISVLVGFLRMNVKSFVISVALGKFFQYALLIFGVQMLVRFLPFGMFA